ncbi:protein TolQ [Sphingorhabdus pulchriflava]|uniref:Protein TolQ n=1 Tax=Sphingorhabdus pulchriflava TaxID=2292257 RepID=A0A371B5L0_9SPHN|nr:protein TolQ [Sphingorhabdus pulchriflava]RDV02868.1 protein TolQ [Sphingorhabdus pulchriflava]
MDLLILSQGASFSPIQLFLDADLVVKAVIIGLALASIWVWTIIVSFVLKIRGINNQSEAFEREFWRTEDVDGYFKQHGKSDLPIAKVFAAGLAEWRRSTAVKTPDRQGTRERLATAMDSSIAAESEKLANRLNFLATTGAVAPFVGLFGTVWGIMRSFAAIAAEQNSSLAVVAPGIAEALFATAIGLFAAIPAVIAYNRFSHRLNQYEARMGRFADGFHGLLSRELEREG